MLSEEEDFLRKTRSTLVSWVEALPWKGEDDLTLTLNW